MFTWLRTARTNPKSSWEHFVKGCVIFTVGLVVLVLGLYLANWLFYVGLTVLLAGFSWAMLGYIGIFIYRMSFATRIKSPRSSKK